MIHDEGTGLGEDLVPHVKGGAYGQAAVTGGGMHVDIFESGGIENFPVGDAIESYAACQADGFQAGFFGELSQHAEINLLEAGLQRGGKILVALLERLVGMP